jgi:hypothetical protein
MKHHNIAVIITNSKSSIPIRNNVDGTRVSGNWKINLKNLPNLLDGGRFSLHTSKSAVSHDQGQIIGVRVVHDQCLGRRVEITYQPDLHHVDGASLAWGQEKAYW